MTFVVASADAVPAAALRDCLNASFADYLISFPTFDDEGWRAFVRRQGVDLSLSLAALRGDVVTAFALITPRSLLRARVAVMGARPDERGSGAAARLLDNSIAAAAARGNVSIELEAFAQNERAVRLYRSRGFDAVCSLYGFEAPSGTGIGRDADVVEISQEDAARWANALDRDIGVALPMQVCGEAILNAPAAPSVWRLGSAQLAFHASNGGVSVMSLLDGDATYADATRLLMSLRCKFPDHALRAPQLHRDDGPARAFERAGWNRAPLCQFLMRREL